MVDVALSCWRRRSICFLSTPLAVLFRGIGTRPALRLRPNSNDSTYWEANSTASDKPGLFPPILIIETARGCLNHTLTILPEEMEHGTHTFRNEFEMAETIIVPRT